MTWPGLTAPTAPPWLPQFRTADERLLWVGQASRTPLAVRWADAFHTGGGLVMLVVGWNLVRGGGPFGAASDGFVALLAWGFIAYGLFEVVGRHVINLVRRWSTSYALTNHRAVIKTGVFSSTLRETSLEAGDLTVRDRRNGHGTILFRSPDIERWYVRAGNRRNRRDLVAATSTGIDGFQFYRIPEVDQVKDLIDSARAELRLED